MTLNRIGGIRTILFDAGNTLAFVDLARVAAVLREIAPGACDRDLAADESGARRAMYRHFEAHPEATDAERWEVYVREMFRRIGVLDEAVAARARARLHAVHAEENLWSHVLPGTAAVLDELRGRGYRLGVVSNSDGRVAELLDRIGLASRFETIVDSHRVGVEKPDPEIFAIALGRLGEPAATTLYVGDFPAVDVVGARGAGLRPVLLDPSGKLPAPDCPVVASLAELAARLPERAVSAGG